MPFTLQNQVEKTYWHCSLFLSKDDLGHISVLFVKGFLPSTFLCLRYFLKMFTFFFLNKLCNSSYFIQENFETHSPRFFNN